MGINCQVQITRTSFKVIQSTRQPTVNDQSTAQFQVAARPHTRQQRRRSLLYLSALLFVVLPSVLAGTYFYLIASDQYVVEVRFAVRGPDGATSSDLLGMVTGVSTAGSTITDSYILMDYLHSRQLIDELRTKIDFEAAFNPPGADFIAAFPVNDRSIERFVEHWQDVVQINFDSTSKIIVLEVRTFSPDHSEQLAVEILRLSELLVNKLSERSRQDALRSARLEVGRMEERMRKSLADMRAFREKAQDIDPSQSAAAQMARLSEIESQINAERAQARHPAQIHEPASTGHPVHPVEDRSTRKAGCRRAGQARSGCRRPGGQGLITERRRRGLSGARN